MAMSIDQVNMFTDMTVEERSRFKGRRAPGGIALVPNIAVSYGYSRGTG